MPFVLKRGCTDCEIVYLFIYKNLNFYVIQYFVITYLFIINFYNLDDCSNNDLYMYLLKYLVTS